MISWVICWKYCCCFWICSASERIALSHCAWAPCASWAAAAQDAQGAQAQWLSAMRSLAEQIQKQQQYFQQMTQEIMSTYSELFNIPLTYAQEGLKDAQFPHRGLRRAHRGGGLRAAQLAL